MGGNTGHIGDHTDPRIVCAAPHLWQTVARMGEQPCRVVGGQRRGLHLGQDRHPCMLRRVVGLAGTEKATETELPDLRVAQDMTEVRR